MKPSDETPSTIPYDGKGWARDDLIRAMLPLVNHIVGRIVLFTPSFLGREDLISAGIVGLIEAVDRYDPDRGCSLKTYCGLRIRGAILDELRRLDWVPRSVHKDSKRLQMAQEELVQKLNREPTETEVMESLGINREEFEELLDRIRPATCFSLQESVGHDDGLNDFLIQEEIIEDAKSPHPSKELLKGEETRIMLEQLHKLPLVQMQVLTLYYIEDLRLKEIAEILDVSESRVSQIHTLAITRLKSAFEKQRDR